MKSLENEVRKSRIGNLNNKNSLNDKRIIITGCGYKPLKKEFHDLVTGKPTHDSIYIDDQEMKLNVGSGIAYVLASKGAIVHMVSRSEEKLNNLKDAFVDSGLKEKQIEYSVVDLLKENQVQNFAKEIPKDKTLYWVQSVGLGAGSYKLKDDNPYLHIKDIPIELIEKESQIVLKGTHLMMQSLFPIFEKQDETRIGVITSMSAIRGYSLGGTHCAAKGALDRYCNSTMLDLYKNNIFLTTIRPGIVDTGMYDGLPVIKAVNDVAESLGITYGENIPLSPPTSIGYVVSTALESQAHIPSINLVAKGQFPHEGS